VPEAARSCASSCAFSFAVLIWLASLAFDAPWAYVSGACACSRAQAPIRAWRFLPDAPVDRRIFPSASAC
jgi:hypothetical protein